MRLTKAQMRAMFNASPPKLTDTIPYENKEPLGAVLDLRDSVANQNLQDVCAKDMNSDEAFAYADQYFSEQG